MTINQLFQIIHPKTLPVTDFQGNSCHLITVNFVILPVHITFICLG